MSNVIISRSGGASSTISTDNIEGILPISKGGTGNETGLAASATILATARAVQVNLASTSSASFNGSEDITPGVAGTLGITNGGTGNTTGLAASATILATSRNIRTNLASTSKASFNGSADVNPGVTGTLALTNGGTGETSIESLRVAIGLDKDGSVPAPIGTTGTYNSAQNSLLSEGWLLCNGSIIYKEDYPELWAASCSEMAWEGSYAPSASSTIDSVISSDVDDFVVTVGDNFYLYKSSDLSYHSSYYGHMAIDAHSICFDIDEKKFLKATEYVASTSSNTCEIATETYSISPWTSMPNSIGGSSNLSIASGNGYIIASSSDYDNNYVGTISSLSLSELTSTVGKDIIIPRFVQSYFYAWRQGYTYLYYSSNATSWSSITSVSVDCYFGIAYGNGIYVLIDPSSFGSSVIYTSTNGRSFTAVNINMELEDYSGIVYLDDPGIFITSNAFSFNITNWYPISGGSGGIKSAYLESGRNIAACSNTIVKLSSTSKYFEYLKLNMVLPSLTDISTSTYTYVKATNDY